jgi:hypothetical protein
MCVVGPFLQWDPIMTGEGENARPLFVHRVELQCDRAPPASTTTIEVRSIPGPNIYSFNPYWAGDAVDARRADHRVRPRLHYLWNE